MSACALIEITFSVVTAMEQPNDEEIHVEKEPSATTTKIEDDQHGTSLSSDTEIRRKKSYSRAFKLQVIAFAESVSKNEASRKFNIDRKQVQRWCKQKEKLEKLPEGRKRLQGGGRKVKNCALDQSVMEWVDYQLEKSVKVMRSDIRVKAQQLHEEHLWNEGLCGKVSEGWMSSFMKRHGLTAERGGQIKKNVQFGLCRLVDGSVEQNSSKHTASEERGEWYCPTGSGRLY